TSQQTKSKAPREGDVLSLEERNMFNNMKIVPEPLGLLTFDFYKFNPTRADLKTGHPIPPCSPTHKNYIEHLATSLRAFQKYPLAFQDLTLCRRAKFDKKMQFDGHCAKEAGISSRDLGGRGEKRKWSLNGSVGSG
ncbi:unnamed protein product, partial [Polarella glacialis]